MFTNYNIKQHKLHFINFPIPVYTYLEAKKATIFATKTPTGIIQIYTTNNKALQRDVLVPAISGNMSHADIGQGKEIQC